MGCVTKVFKKNIHISFQARIVRVGIPIFTICFNSHKEASDWLSENEENYIYNHEECLKKWNRLDLLRKRKKSRTGKI